MFDFLRNLTKTEEEKRQETLSAYLDNALTPSERQVFEEQLRTDTTLQASLEQQQRIKDNIGRLPHLRAPRNFTLDPAAYGRPAPQPAFKLYPVMRAATVAAAVMLIFLFSIELFSPISEQSETLAGAPVETTSEELRDLDNTADQESVAEEPAPEIASQGAGEAAADAVEVVEEAEEDAMEEEPAEEMPEEEQAAEEAEIAPAEPQTADEGANTNDSDAQSTASPNPASEETEAGAAGDDGSTAFIPNPTTTIVSRALPTAAPTLQAYPGDAYLYSSTQTIPSAEPTAFSGAGIDSPPISTRNILRIGAGILFLVLLIATLFLRRQLY